MSKALSQARPAKRRSTLLTIALVLVILQGIFLAVVYWTVLPDEAGSSHGAAEETARST